MDTAAVFLQVDRLQEPWQEDSHLLLLLMGNGHVNGHNMAKTKNKNTKIEDQLSLHALRGYSTLYSPWGSRTSIASFPPGAWGVSVCHPRAGQAALNVSFSCQLQQHSQSWDFAVKPMAVHCLGDGSTPSFPVNEQLFGTLPPSPQDNS